MTGSGTKQWEEAQSSSDSELAKPERIGLLFVHGIGEQKRFEHLSNSVTELAQLIRAADGKARISVVDRTATWTLPPGEHMPDGTPPITVSIRSENKAVDYYCHEVWWADLGARASVVDQLLFWLWGLGQWGAPIYREIDESRLIKDGEINGKAVASLVKLPEGVAGDLIDEPLARFRLTVAGLAAFFVAMTWVLAKRLLAGLLGQSPDPTLIVQYVGDVRTYTEPGGPGAGVLSDPGYPRRVGIRRRMVTEMVGMAAQGLDGWYVLSHSLGTVVAYNGLTEIGHTLPNYLSEDQWCGLPQELKEDPGCALRPDLSSMMPARPPWLERQHCMNRPVLFRGLKGFLTYGSPLGKFAALWPRIIATATDRNDGVSPFPKDCRWINFAAPHDPVAGILRSFPVGPADPLHGALPEVENVQTPNGMAFGLSHIQYLKGFRQFAAGIGVEQKKALAHWIMGDAAAFRSASLSWIERFCLIRLPYAFIICLLWIATAALAALALGLGKALTSGGQAGWGPTVVWLADVTVRTSGPVLGVALGIVAVFGLLRWYRENRLNLLLAESERSRDAGNRDEYWRVLIHMLKRHDLMSLPLTVVASICVPLSLVQDIIGLPAAALFGPHLAGFYTVSVSALLIFAATILQTLANRLVPSARNSVAITPTDRSS